jgi:hypothetical protein
VANPGVSSDVYVLQIGNHPDIKLFFYAVGLWINHEIDCDTDRSAVVEISGRRSDLPVRNWIMADTEAGRQRLPER